MPKGIAPRSQRSGEPEGLAFLATPRVACARNAAGRGKKPNRRVSGYRMLDQVVGSEEGA